MVFFMAVILWGAASHQQDRHIFTMLIKTTMIPDSSANTYEWSIEAIFEADTSEIKNNANTANLPNWKEPRFKKSRPAKKTISQAQSIDNSNHQHSAILKPNKFPFPNNLSHTTATSKTE
jgi:hypothetical protein